MSETAATTKRVAKPKSKPKKQSHPTFEEMIAKAILGLGDKKGSSKIAIKKYILSNFKVEDNKSTNTRLNVTLKKGVEGGKLVTAKGHAGTFKAAKAEAANKAPKKNAAKKPPAAKKSAAKKASPKKVAKTATKAKKPATSKKTPTKKVVKPKTAKKTPAKKPVARKPAPKKTLVRKAPAK